MMEVYNNMGIGLRSEMDKDNPVITNLFDGNKRIAKILFFRSFDKTLQPYNYAVIMDFDPTVVFVPNQFMAAMVIVDRYEHYKGAPNGNPFS